MQLKNLLTSSLLLTLTLPLSVLGGKGRISYYEPKPSKSQPPSCGSDSIYLGDYYIALNKEQLDSDKSNLCGKCVKIVYKNKYLVGRIVDRCSGCGYGGLDISPSMFHHFEELKTGIFNTNWEYVSCDNYGKKGTCSDSSCGISGSSSGSDSKSKSKSTTTTTKAAPTTTSVKPTTTNASPVSTSISSLASSTTVAPNTSNTITSTITNGTNSTEVQSSADPSILGAANNNSTITQTSITNSTDVNNNNNNNAKGNEPVIINDVEKEDKEEKGDSGSLVIPVTGVLMVSGAAGIGLFYAKSKRNDVNSLKKAFPEAFKSIKRSLTHGSSIRRNITRTFTKKSPELRNNTNIVDSTSNGKDASTSQCVEMDISETRINVN